MCVPLFHRLLHWTECRGNAGPGSISLVQYNLMTKLLNRDLVDNFSFLTLSENIEQDCLYVVDDNPNGELQIISISIEGNSNNCLRGGMLPVLSG